MNIKRRNNGNKALKVIDFFCGAGGFSEGFRQAGYDIIFAVDKWEPAVRTYRGNKPEVNVVLDDVVRISNLPDDEFNHYVPDSDVIIGSPPCQAFSQSNKSGHADKTMGIILIEAYLRIVARKKFKKNSILKYWVLENVPNSQNYIKDQYSAADLGLDGDFVLYTRGENAGIYNAKYFGAPTNRNRFLCGSFPALIMTNSDDNVVTLGQVLKSIGNPMDNTGVITDINYPDLTMDKDSVTDLRYIHELAPFEWKTCQRLKQDKGYMGRMSFPENLSKPARTVMATMTGSSREAMVLPYLEGRYRLPTVREAASMMSFPLDFRFYGDTKGIKHTLVGNAVPPKLSYAIAIAIAKAEGQRIPQNYIPIKHDETISFINLNGLGILKNNEKPRRDVAKFKYHIPYLIIDAYRVELTNYYSDFNNKVFRWDVELHYSQGKLKAKKYSIDIIEDRIPRKYRNEIDFFLKSISKRLCSFNDFQRRYCETSVERIEKNHLGPYEVLDEIRSFINQTIPKNDYERKIIVDQEPYELPEAIMIGYFILQQIIEKMRGQ